MTVNFSQVMFPTCLSDQQNTTALDAGRERQEAIAQPIGNMRKTDRQLVLGRKHEVTSEFVGYANDSAQTTSRMLACRRDEDSPGRHSSGQRRQGERLPATQSLLGNNRRGTATWIWSKVSSRPEEFHLWALPEPCMTLSSHTAPDVRPLP